jgi:hypothetical protein
MEVGRKRRGREEEMKEEKEEGREEEGRWRRRMEGRGEEEEEGVGVSGEEETSWVRPGLGWRVEGRGGGVKRRNERRVRGDRCCEQADEKVREA